MVSDFATSLRSLAPVTDTPQPKAIAVRQLYTTLKERYNELDGKFRYYLPERKTIIARDDGLVVSFEVTIGKASCFVRVVTEPQDVQFVDSSLNLFNLASQVQTQQKTLPVTKRQTVALVKARVSRPS